ncbi:XTP/dITP diphosphatase [Aerococcaceae bacterium zg-1292]|uniref:XTP/dITP diphosphatase n=1 Tax=Aerococcaceae bacterium zg-1292 TaxID=2774330 RepID=UPI0019C3A10C|nr:XTP/dITP diphosphatase [Aerococcaceae bacterium zg-1292]
MSKILIATHNPGKVKEFTTLFSPLGIKVESLLDYPELEEVEETGATFEENARLKAETIARMTNSMVLADDSGLCVDALNGAPGIYSARYAGEPTDNLKNNQKLLSALEGVANRQAHFICCLVLAHPDVDSLVVEGRVDGEIATQMHGEQGFGYDPVFYIPSEQKTFAQMPEKKSEIGHRAMALKALLEKMPDWLNHNAI